MGQQERTEVVRLRSGLCLISLIIDVECRAAHHRKTPCIRFQNRSRPRTLSGIAAAAHRIHPCNYHYMNSCKRSCPLSAQSVCFLVSSHGHSRDNAGLPHGTRGPCIGHTQSRNSVRRFGGSAHIDWRKSSLQAYRAGGDRTSSGKQAHKTQGPTARWS